jgi:hypothetical protein
MYVCMHVCMYVSVGIGAQLMRDIPFYGSFFGSYDLLCRGIKANTTWTDTFTYLVAGGLVLYVCMYVCMYGRK